MTSRTEDYVLGFREGVKMFFDYLYSRTCNNYHGNKKINEACEKDNALIISWAADALGYCSPDDHADWIQISDLLKQIADLKSKLSEATKVIESREWKHSADELPEEGVLVKLSFDQDHKYYLKKGSWHKCLTSFNLGFSADIHSQVMWKYLVPKS